MKFGLNYLSSWYFTKTSCDNLKSRTNSAIFIILPLYIHKKFIFTLIVVGIFKESLW